MESYLEHHGDKLAKRFDANSYIVLSEAMNHHDVGRGRGGVERALGSVRADVTVAGIVSDRLYPLELQLELGRILPGGRPVAIVESQFGHDGFLFEVEQIGKIVVRRTSSGSLARIYAPGRLAASCGPIARRPPHGGHGTVPSSRATGSAPAGRSGWGVTTHSPLRVLSGCSPMSGMGAPKGRAIGLESQAQRRTGAAGGGLSPPDHGRRPAIPRS